MAGPEELEQTVGVDDPALRRKAAMEEKAQKLQKRLEAMQQSKVCGKTAALSLSRFYSS